jgi:single-strand DNA-binding protein
MSTIVNRVELTGFLGGAPRTTTSANGTQVATASIAVHTSFKQGEGWQKRTDWFRLVAFGGSAERLASFGEGDRIAVQGRLQTSEYTDREGVKRTSVEVVVFRSEPAPLPRKAQTAEPEPAVEEVAEEALVVDVGAEPTFEFAEEPVVDVPAEPVKKPRRRKQAA